MWGVQGTLQAPHLSAATGLRLSSPVSRRVERVHTRVGRVVPGHGHFLVVECKDEGIRYFFLLNFKAFSEWVTELYQDVGSLSLFYGAAAFAGFLV